MNVIKNKLAYLVGIYSRFDPLIYQRRYAKKTLRSKKNIIAFEKIDKHTLSEIRKLWGRKGLKNDWFSFYYTIGNKKCASLYFPDNWFFDYIDSYVNDWHSAKNLDDKNLYDLYFADVDRPKTIGRCNNGLWLDREYNIITIDRLVDVCEKINNGIIIKPSIGSSGGHGIKFWHNSNRSDLKDILIQYNNCVIQEIIEQHPILAQIHKESINTIRIMTILLDNEVRILSSILRMGMGNSKVDNVSSGGLACGIDICGCLKDYAFNANGQRWEVHPSGTKFKGIVVPSFYECCEICKKVAPRFSRISRLISWDFAIDTKGLPLLIEANLYGGELDFHQMCNGPIFGDENTTIMMIQKFFR